jgi:hypothetical protein
MSGITGVDLTNKVVRLRQSVFKPGLDAAEHLFRCECGSGCNPTATGRDVFGMFVSDGEQARISRDDVEEVVDV